MEVNTQQNMPACDIRIDKEGVWYYRGAEMFRREFVNYFYQHLHLDAEGRYLIELPNERCYVEVEDTAYIVKAVDSANGNKECSNQLNLRLCDDTIESLDPETLYIGADNVMYCRIRKGRFPARFSRAAYYQLAEYIEHDTQDDSYYLRINGHRHEIRHNS